jgi:hypothetical protein
MWHTNFFTNQICGYKVTKKDDFYFVRRAERALEYRLQQKKFKDAQIVMGSGCGQPVGLRKTGLLRLSDRVAPNWSTKRLIIMHCRRLTNCSNLSWPLVCKPSQISHDIDPTHAKLKFLY